MRSSSPTVARYRSEAHAFTEAELYRAAIELRDRILERRSAQEIEQVDLIRYEASLDEVEARLGAEQVIKCNWPVMLLAPDIVAWSITSREEVVSSARCSLGAWIRSRM